MTDDSPPTSGIFDVFALAKTLPEQTKAMIADHYLTDRATASARVFRVYRPVPAHFHRTCDEFLYVVSGRGRFWVGDPSNATAFEPGHLICFDRTTVHSIPELIEEPVVFLSIDTPRRAPDDIVFVDPTDGSPQTFMARNATD